MGGSPGGVQRAQTGQARQRNGSPRLQVRRGMRSGLSRGNAPPQKGLIVPAFFAQIQLAFGVIKKHDSRCRSCVPSGFRPLPHTCALSSSALTPSRGKAVAEQGRPEHAHTLLAHSPSF
eukprot:360626-Chlamydomonas_euryale.AAC.8